jgi:hypothetical protein
MSCYEWERGEFKFSVAEYRKFKKAFASGVKDQYQIAYENAVYIYNKIIAEGKGKRNVEWCNLYGQFRYKEVSTGSYFVSYENKDLDPFRLAYESMFRKKDHNSKPLKPRKGDFKIKIESKDLSFEGDEFSIGFDDKNRIVHWHVSENNHACESARSEEVGKLFFNLLNNVKWTRGTGGLIVGNNEYNQDDYGVGGGGNTINDSYGPLGKDERRRAFAC